MGFKEIVSFVFVYCFSCSFSYFFTVDDNALKIGKNVAVNNRVLQFCFSFPISLYVLIKGKSKKIKSNKLNIFGIVLYCLNAIVLLGGIALQILPDIPCKSIDIEFGPRYRSFAFVADTYNEKVPLLSIWILTFLQVAIILIKIVIMVLRKKETIKSNVGSLVFFFFLILLTLGITIYFSYLLFQ